MKDDEPLNVQVARALNWTDIHWSLAQGCYGRHPSGVGGSDGKGYTQIPRYGHDSPDGWAVTGPLIREYGIELRWDIVCKAVKPVEDGDGWIDYQGSGDHYAEAIARCIVLLGENGKLVKA